MSYCGKSLTNFSHYRHKIKKYLEVMQNDYGIYHNDIREGNVCIHNGQLYFIDFGWARTYPGEAGYADGKLGDPKTVKSHTSTPPNILKTDKPRALSRQDLLNVLLSIHLSNELQSDYLKQNVYDIIRKEKMLDKDPLSESSDKTKKVAIRSVPTKNGPDNDSVQEKKDTKLHIKNDRYYDSSDDEVIKRSMALRKPAPDLGYEDDTSNDKDSISNSPQNDSSD
jgi:hypothetical protein